MENWILWYIIKKVLQFFELFWAHLVYKYAKSANMTPKIFSPIIFNMALKNAEFDVNFESIEKYRYQESLHKES